MKIAEYTQEELIAMWRPQALLRAESGKGVITISEFLRSKGIEHERAKLLAEELVTEGQRKARRSARPLKIIGWTFIAIGVFIPVATFVMDRGFYAVTLTPIVLGSAFVWGDSREV